MQAVQLASSCLWCSKACMAASRGAASGIQSAAARDAAPNGEAACKLRNSRKCAPAAADATSSKQPAVPLPVPSGRPPSRAAAPARRPPERPAPRRSASPPALRAPSPSAARGGWKNETGEGIEHGRAAPPAAHAHAPPHTLAPPPACLAEVLPLLAQLLHHEGVEHRLLRLQGGTCSLRVQGHQLRGTEGACNPARAAARRPSAAAAAATHPAVQDDVDGGGGGQRACQLSVALLGSLG